VPLESRPPAATCSGCGGVFVDERRLDRALGAGAPARMSMWWRTPELRCPACDADMRVMLVDEIQVDRCLEHGVWHDGGELARLIRTSGGDAQGDIVAALRRLLEAAP
jgi:Zn-finger nucleic acid-binding protein